VFEVYEFDAVVVVFVVVFVVFPVVDPFLGYCERMK
jgi:hypothetical protein